MIELVAPRRDGHEVRSPLDPAQIGNGAVPFHSEIHIRPTYSWLQIDWREIWEHRELIWLLVRRDYLAKYRQTLLGPIWFFLQPVLLTLVFALVFGNITRFPATGVPSFLFYFCGLLSWNYFSQTATHVGNTFLSNETLFGKVYFPRLIVPLAQVVSNAMSFGIQFVTFILFWGYFKWSGASITMPLESLWLLPLLALQLMALSLGVGLCLSSLTAKYRDLSHVLGFLFQLGMYATPIIYTLAQIPARWRWIIALNPMSSIVETSRHLLLGSNTTVWHLLLLSFVETLLLLVLGVALFTRTSRNFIDTI